METPSTASAGTSGLAAALPWLRRATRILVFTGAGISTEFGHSRLSRAERCLEDHRPEAVHDRELHERSIGARGALARSPGAAILERRAECRAPGGDPPPARGSRPGGRDPEHRRSAPEGGSCERHRAARHVVRGDVPRLQPANAHRRGPRPSARGRRGPALRTLRRPAQDRDDQLRSAVGGGRYGSSYRRGTALRRMSDGGVDALGLAGGGGAGGGGPSGREAGHRE